MGATVAPIILASDATRLSQFGGDKTAWPVYLTLGNVAKAIRRQPNRRATLLLGYLPTSKLECFTENQRKEEKHHLFHYAMSRLLAPLVTPGREGARVMCADGQIRHVFPILAAYIADFPEQCLVACCKESRCPKCLVQHDRRGEPLDEPGINSRPRMQKDILQTLHRHMAGLSNTLKEDGIRDDVYAPFWADLPHVDIFSCLTPDILHQLHKGVFKEHLVEWCINLAGAEELDARFQTMTSHAGLRHFKKGISVLTQWTGTEAKHLQKVFLGVLSGTVHSDVIKAVRAILDFIYYAHFSSHSTKTLAYMEVALQEFHKHKEIFVKLEQRTHYNIPKVHAMQHYISAIHTRGTADGYNTELPEQLHINLAKEGYRASNRRDYIEQMVRWLRRQESVNTFTAYLEWAMPEGYAADLDSASVDQDKDLDCDEMAPTDLPEVPGEEGQTEQTTQSANISWGGLTMHTLAKHVPLPMTTVYTLQEKYGAHDFLPCLRVFIQQHIPNCDVLPSNIDHFDVYKRVKLSYTSLQSFGDPPEEDTIRATPVMPSRRAGRQPTPAHFDTALVDVFGEAEPMGMKGILIAG
jgi:Plavaka transposase